MERVRVSADSLNNANTSIMEFKEHLFESISKCETSLKKQFDGIDERFKEELSDYIEQLHSLKNDVESFETQNTIAIKDRLTKISEYSKTSYKRRNVF